MGYFSRNRNDRKKSPLMREFDKVKFGSAIPYEGALSYFYEFASSHGDSTGICHLNKCVFFHTNFDTDIQSVELNNYGWNIESYGDNVILTLIFKQDPPYRIPLMFNRNDDAGRNMLDAIKSKKKVEIFFLSIACGEIIKEKKGVFDIPERVLDDMEL